MFSIYGPTLAHVSPVPRSRHATCILQTCSVHVASLALSVCLCIDYCSDIAVRLCYMLLAVVSV